MIKEFYSHIAWTDAMREGSYYVGLIGYQSKQPYSAVNTLWVIDPNNHREYEAELAAAKMLQNILDITANGRVIYNDGVVL